MNQPAQQSQELVAQKNPWEKSRDETAKAFRAFCLFRDLLAKRSLSQVAEILVEESPERKPATVLTQMKKWSVQHGWVARAEAYDEYLDERCREQAETEHQSMQRRYRESAAQAFDILAQRLAPNPPEGVKPLNANDQNLSQIVRAMDRLQMIEDRSSAASHRSLAHVNCISRRNFLEVVENVYDGLMRWIPEARQPRAAAGLKAYFDGDASHPI